MDRGMTKPQATDFDLDQPMTKATTLSVYEGLRGYMPQANQQTHQQGTSNSAVIHAERLRDILSHFDALLLDGYGVLNIGAEAVDGAADLLSMAQSAGVATMVLTNGASKPTHMTWSKYQTLGLHLDPSQIISSRDAVLAFLANPQSKIKTLGMVDGFAEGVKIDGVTVKPLHPHQPEAWHDVDAIGFFGAVYWAQDWQDCLINAMAKGVQVLVANPDVAAPHETAYSREPGYWIAAACQQLSNHTINPYDQVHWFGKPHAPVFDLALQRLEEFTARSNWKYDRIAMVGDSLHTDILGGQAYGLKTVLITGHGLFRDGGASEAITTTGIVPDFITATI